MERLLHLDERVALLIDCDNTSPAILDYALQVASRFGRPVLRRGYGNHATLSHKWQHALVSHAFTPHLQYQHVAGKNTVDIALALDALEAMFDKRADTFCIVTSDSDFAYLCQKLRERGARVYIVGEAKTPTALRNAGDSFFEWVDEKAGEPAVAARIVASPASPARPAQSLDFLRDAVRLLGSKAPGGKVPLAGLGQHLKTTYPDFSASNYGYSRLVNLVKSCDMLKVSEETNGHFSVRLCNQPAKATA